MFFVNLREDSKVKEIQQNQSNYAFEIIQPLGSKTKFGTFFVRFIFETKFLRINEQKKFILRIKIHLFKARTTKSLIYTFVYQFV